MNGPIDRHFYGQGRVWFQPAEPFGPFDEVQAVFKGFEQAKLQGFIGAAQAIEIRMPYLEIGRIIGLHEGIGRRRNVGFFAAKGTDDSARKKRLSSANIATKQEDIAFSDERGESAR